MIYTVRLTSNAIDSMVKEARWWAEHFSASQALVWYDGFIKALKSLEQMPRRCPLAYENARVSFDLYQLLYGTGTQPTHRALFRVEDNVVVVLLIRRHSQQDIQATDLES